MDRQTIISRVHAMNTKGDLLKLLNDLKKDDLGEKAYPFNMKQLMVFCNPNRIARRYKQFDIPKKSGKEPRHITAPVKTLKSLLTYVNVILQAMYEPLPCVMGFTIGRSVTDNGKCHIGQHYVYNIDLKDFFPSVHQARIWKKLQCPPFNFKDDEKKGMKRRVLADVIAGICCMKTNDGKYVLPQGAPTSPVLTNIICERLDWKLTGLAKRFGVNYSRYADDITFSSPHNVYQEGSDFIKELHRIIEDQNFTINKDKTRLCRSNERQEVTGLTVNVKTNVTRKYVQDIRHLLYVWRTKGYEKAYMEFLPHYKQERGHVKKGNPVLENVLSGKLEYLKMVKGENDSTYLRLRLSFDALMNERVSQSKMLENAKSDWRYIVTYRISEFEDTFKTKVEILQNNAGKTYAAYTIDGKKNLISISQNVDVKHLDQCVISYCESRRGKRFYLIHHPANYDKAKELTANVLSQTLDKLVASEFDLNILLNNGAIQ